MKQMTIAEIHDVNLEILKHFDGFCRTHGLRYWLSDGSLLGAVRHQGFIPWDDDSDVALPRPDYERFIREYVDNDEYKFYAHEKGNSFLTYGRLCEVKKTVFRCVTNWTNETPGVGIDVFPIDGAPDDRESWNDFIERYRLSRQKIFDLRDVVLCTCRFRHSFWGGAKDLVHFVVWILQYPIRKYCLLAALKRDREMRLAYDYDECSTCHGLVCAMVPGKIYQKAWFEKTVDVQFSGVTLQIPVAAAEMLKWRYGADYMTPPPESKRVVHSISQTMWWKD